MAVSIILHYHFRAVTLLVIINYYDICSQTLSIDDLLRKFANSSLHQQHIFRIRVLCFSLSHTDLIYHFT